jgi:tellurite resistance protein TerB
MGLFSKFVKSTKKIENKNVMEATVGACLLIAAADGTIERSETDKMEKLISVNPKLEAFKGRPIKDTITRYTGMLEADFNYGKKKMLDEISDIADNSDDAEEVLYMALAISKSDGEMEPEELAVLKEIARVLALNINDFGITEPK